MADDEEARAGSDHPVFARDVWISEKRGVSLARDRKTGRFTGEPGQDRLSARIRRVLRGEKSQTRSG
jgi:hypothetical protein